MYTDQITDSFEASRKEKKKDFALFVNGKVINKSHTVKNVQKILFIYFHLKFYHDKE